jgi:hypothetical protein
VESFWEQAKRKKVECECWKTLRRVSIWQLLWLLTDSFSQVRCVQNGQNCVGVGVIKIFLRNFFNTKCHRKFSIYRGPLFILHHKLSMNISTWMRCYVIIQFMHIDQEVRPAEGFSLRPTPQENSKDHCYGDPLSWRMVDGWAPITVITWMV